MPADSGLVAAGRGDLASQVVHVAKVEGDSAGYDIRSFASDSNFRYIEVKTTSGAATTAFFITPNEIDFSARHPNDAASDSGRYYEVPGSVTTHFGLAATEYRAKLL